MNEIERENRRRFNAESKNLEIDSTTYVGESLLVGNGQSH